MISFFFFLSLIKNGTEARLQWGCIDPPRGKLPMDREEEEEEEGFSHFPPSSLPSPPPMLSPHTGASLFPI